MAITPTSQDISIFPVANYVYTVTGMVNGANAIALPVPPATGSFPPDGLWTPTQILCFPYNIGSAGALVTPDLTTIANSNGSITFTLYSTGSTNCLIIVM